MAFAHRSSYRGPAKLVILDWAGATPDHGCYPPAVVFVEVFGRCGEETIVRQTGVPRG